MNLKEVCIRVNLTEEIIHYYVNNGLISPVIESNNGEEHLSFNEDNISRLDKIASLTKWDFSVDHIIEMHHHPNQISNILSQHLILLSLNAHQHTDVIRAIECIQHEVIPDVYHLVERLSVKISRNSLSEIATKYKFSRFEGVSPEEKELAYEQFVASQKKRETIQKIFKPLKIGVVVLIVIAILARIIILISGIPHTIDKQLSAVQFKISDESIIENTTITIKGKLYKQWFTDYRFEGTFVISNYEITKTANLIGIVFYKEMLDSRGNLAYSTYINREHGLNMFADIKMTDDFDNVLIRIFEPVESDSKSANDLWMAAPANSREEAILLWDELKY